MMPFRRMKLFSITDEFNCLSNQTYTHTHTLLSIPVSHFHDTLSNHFACAPPVVSNMDSPLSDRVDQQFQSVNLPVHDINGMMRHVLDCFGALKVRLAEEPFSPALITTFGHAVRAFIDHITGYELIDEQSGMKFLMDSFPDESKKRDGRGWLPLHWAAAVHNTDPGHLKDIMKERPYAVQKGHMPFNNTGDEEPTTFSYRGMLPLHFAVGVKHPILPNIRALLQARPEVLELADQRGWLPIHWCSYNSRSPEALRLVLTKYRDGLYIATKKGKLPFQLSAYNRSTDLMEILYNENPEAVEGLDYNGNTPLHDAGTFCFSILSSHLLADIHSCSLYLSVCFVFPFYHLTYSLILMNALALCVCFCVNVCTDKCFIRHLSQKLQYRGTLRTFQL